MGSLNQYSIQFSGLKEGKYDFTFEIGNELFKHFENTEIIHAEIVVEVSFEKKASHLSLQFEIEGKLTTSCDRCLEPIEIEIEDEQELYVNFGDETSDLTDIDNIMVLARNEDKLDLSKHFYDYIMLNIPIKKIHPDDENGNSTCNPEMIKKLEEYMSSDADNNSTDPRWDKLKNLFN